MILAASAGDAIDGEMLHAWLVTAVALGLGLLGRRRLPIGAAEGLFSGAVSALLLLNFVVLSPTSEGLFLLGASFASLAVVWFVVAVWVERETAPAPDEVTARHRGIRRALSVHAAAVAALLGVAVLLSAFEQTRALAPGLVLLLGLLLAVAGGLYVRQRGVLNRHAMAALLLALLWLAVPRPVLEARRAAVVLGLFLVGLLLLAVVLATVLTDWRRRVHIWQTLPERLTELPARHRRVYGLNVAACVAVGVGGVLLYDAGLTPLAVVFAALAALIIGHCWRSNAVGELGLALLGESVFTAVVAWLPASPARALLGGTLAGVYLLWLARFWEQQLNAGQPWTTAGRLIPAARHLSYAAAGGEFVLAAMWALSADQASTPAGWQAALAALLMLVHWSMLVRDAAKQQSATASLAACLVLVAALVPIQQLAARLGLPLTPGVLLAAAGLALALRVGGAARGANTAWVWNAYIGGLIPLAIAYDLALGELWLAHRGLAFIAGACVLVAIGVHWGRGARAAR